MDFKDVAMPIAGKVALGLPQMCELRENWAGNVRQRMEKDTVYADGDDGNRHQCSCDLSNFQHRAITQGKGGPYCIPKIGLHVVISAMLRCIHALILCGSPRTPQMVNFISPQSFLWWTYVPPLVCNTRQLTFWNKNLC